MKVFEGRGGAQLNVPRGKWVTGSFNLTSDFTLFLEEAAAIVGSEISLDSLAKSLEHGKVLQQCENT